MLNNIIDYALKNRFVILLLAVITLATGVYITREMEVDVFPDLTAPTVVVLTESPGMAPEEVERLVTFPIETAVNGATNIRRVRSSSAMGFSIVWVEFEWNMDIYDARQLVSEKLATIMDKLPRQAGSPTLAPQSSIMGEIMIIGLTADSTSMLDLRTLAEWNIRPRILAVGGVAQVTIIGGELKEYQVLANPNKLKFHSISFHELINTVRASNENASGGFVNEYGNKYLIRGMGRTANIEELGNNVIKTIDGYPIRVSDVAEVKIGASPKIGDGSYNGNPAVLLTLTKQPNVNTLLLTQNIKEALKEIQSTLPEDIDIHTDIFEQAQFIETSVNNVQKALFEGAIFVVIILFVFLMNYRTTIISILAIPLSLLFAVIVLKLMGITINTMTLGGMTIAIGSLVDDAIIDVENVYKRLRENIGKPKTQRRPALKVIYEASVEIRASILNATLIIIVAFTPLFFLTGLEGRMLKPLGIAYIVSLFASLVVAVTVIPVLSSYMLTRESQLNKHKEGSKTERFLKKHYELSLRYLYKRKKWVFGFAGSLFVLAVILLSGFGRSFLPPFNEGSLTINTATLPGTSLEISGELGGEAERKLRALPEINATARRTGRAELAEHAFGVNVSEIDVPFQLGERDRNSFLREVREQLQEIPGIVVEVGQPISHRIDAMLSGTRANIAIKLFGTNLNDMFRIASQIKGEIAEIEGIADLVVEQQIEIPQLQIKPNREMLARYGIPMNEFMEYISVAFGGETLSEVFENQQSFNLVLRLDDPYRDNLEAIQHALLDTKDGKKVPLSYVSDIQSTTGPNTISRENVMRKLVVSVNIAERDVRGVVNEIKETINNHIELPENYWIEYGGQFESEANASKTLAITSLGAILIIFMLLYVEFRQLKLAGVVLLNLPLALIGGVFAIRFTSGVLSIPAIIGFITLFGIATRNGILLISRYENLKTKSMGIKERIILGSTDRLNPILMTALTAALALLPLALAGDKPGNEIQSPMAVVILGGLLSSTFLNAYVIPLIYGSLASKTTK